MAKREHGYKITMTMFVPVDRSDLNDTTTKATAVHAAQTANDLSGLVGVGEILSVTHRWTSREAAVVEAPTQADVEAASAGQAGEVTVETVQPDPVEPQETASAGDQQQDAVEEAATGRRRTRAV